MTRTSLIMTLLVWPALAGGATIDLPPASVLQSESITDFASYDMPVGPFGEAGVPMRPEVGLVTQQTWRIESASRTTLQIIDPIRDQLLEQGFEIVFECKDMACGGFDFRFGSAILGLPEMYVDLADFRYLAAENPAERQSVSLVASRSSRAGFLQITQVGPAGSGPQDVEPVVAPEPDIGAVQPPAPDLAASLASVGHAILGDLSFETGSSDLSEGSYASLDELAALLLADPDLRVALVGHTDASGSLETNIALSKRRAASVMARLIRDYGVPQAQLAAEGMGFLSPIADNRTPQGREANRRVEVIVTSTN